MIIWRHNHGDKTCFRCQRKLLDKEGGYGWPAIEGHPFCCEICLYNAIFGESGQPSEHHTELIEKWKAEKEAQDNAPRRHWWRG